MAGEAGEPPSSGLSRDRLVQAALELVQAEGLDALSMRALADRLHVKAASLYWHVRNRSELLELVAAALLSEGGLPQPITSGDWRAAALSLCSALERVMMRRRDAARVLLEVPGAVERSQVRARLAEVLGEAGLPAGLASETALLMLAAVLAACLRPPAPAPPPVPTPQPLELAIDSGSRGVRVRAGPAMSGPIRAAHDRLGPVPGVVRGDRVIVRLLRGGRQGELELNPAHPWRVHVQAPTWDTTLHLLGLDVRGIKIDSGAGRVECSLPAPRGVVPVEISSGVVGVRLRRPPGVAVVAEVSPGSVQLRLDGRSVGPISSDLSWHSRAVAADWYQLRIHSGTVRVSLEEDASLESDPLTSSPPPPRLGVAAALNVVLDGVAARSRR